MIGGTACDATNATGCDKAPGTISVGYDPFLDDANPFGIAVDQSTDTINGNSSNGANAAGCDHARTHASVGGYPGSIALDPHVGTAYVQAVDGVSVIPLNQ